MALSFNVGCCEHMGHDRGINIYKCCCILLLQLGVLFPKQSSHSGSFNITSLIFNNLLYGSLYCFLLII